MKTHSKLWSEVFSKYANKGIYKVKQLQDYNNFDGAKRLNETVSLAELTKMLRDAKVVPRLITKQEV